MPQQMTYAEFIGTRANNPEKRADLSEALHDASERLVDAVIDLQHALVLPLEAHPENRSDVLPMDRHQDVLAAAADYEEVTCAAMRFLMEEGHTFKDSGELHAPAVWEALPKVDEERLADAAAAVREGTGSRRRFAEVRAEVERGRARFDAALDVAVGLVPAQVEAEVA